MFYKIAVLLRKQYLFLRLGKSYYYILDNYSQLNKCTNFHQNLSGSTEGFLVSNSLIKLIINK
jgi:hypothetical protein